MDETTIKLTRNQVCNLRNIVIERINSVIEEMNAITIFNPDYNIKGIELENLAILNNKLSDCFISMSNSDDESCEQLDDERESEGNKKLKVVKLICDLGIKEGDYLQYDNGDEFLVVDTKHRKCVNYKGKAYSLCEIMQDIYNLKTNHSYEHFWFQGKKLSDLSKEVKKRG